MVPISQEMQPGRVLKKAKKERKRDICDKKCDRKCVDYVINIAYVDFILRVV